MEENQCQKAKETGMNLLFQTTGMNLQNSGNVVVLKIKIWSPVKVLTHFKRT